MFAGKYLGPTQSLCEDLDMFQAHAQGGQEVGCHCYDACPTGSRVGADDISNLWRWKLCSFSSQPPAASSPAWTVASGANRFFPNVQVPCSGQAGTSCGLPRCQGGWLEASTYM